MQPKSKSSISITENDVNAPPAVELGLLDTSEENENTIKYTNVVTNISSQFVPEFGAVNLVPGDAGVTEFFVRNTSTVGGHFVVATSGGSAVGRVLDSKLRVKGSKTFGRR